MRYGKLVIVGGCCLRFSNTFSSRSNIWHQHNPCKTLFWYCELWKFWELLESIGPFCWGGEQHRYWDTGGQTCSHLHGHCYENSYWNIQFSWIHFTFPVLALVVLYEWYWRGNTKNELQRKVVPDANIYLQRWLGNHNSESFISPKSIFFCQKKPQYELHAYLEDYILCQHTQNLPML